VKADPAAFLLQMPHAHPQADLVDLLDLQGCVPGRDLDNAEWYAHC